MKCPFCHETDNRVIDSRLSKDSNMIRRRRECSDCNRRFTTYERVEEMMPLVVKKDGRRESYDRIKIINGLKRACEKRPVSINTVEAIADRIERNLQERGEKEIPSSVIGETLMRELHDTDQVAYVRFASVYRSFKDINEFMVELEELIKERKSVPATNSTRPRREQLICPTDPGLIRINVIYAWPVVSPLKLRAGRVRIRWSARCWCEAGKSSPRAFIGSLAKTTRRSLLSSVRA
jgi:transcriptional repressor NrdR